MVVRAPQPFDPLSGATMLLYAFAARNLSVRHIAKKHVLKGVLRVPSDHRSPLATNEILPLQRSEELVGVGDRHVHGRSNTTGPEDLAVNGSLVKQSLLVPRKRIEPRGDHALDRLRQVSRCPAVSWAGARRAAIALSSFLRCPSGTPSSRKS